MTMAVQREKSRTTVDPSIASIVRRPSRFDVPRLSDSHSPIYAHRTKMSLPFRFNSVDAYLDGTIIKLQSGAQNFKSLKIGKYYLRGSDLESHHMILLLQHAKDNSNLKEVSLHGVTIDEQAASALASLFSTTPRKWEKVVFNFCRGEGVRVLSAPTLIECIRIKNCQIGQDEFTALGLNLQLNRLLTKLELFEEDLRGAGPGQALEDGLAITRSLETLEFSYCRFDDDGVRSLASGLLQNKSIVNFMCPGCELEDGQLSLLTGSLSNNPRLRHIKIFRNHCGLEGASAVASILAKQETDGGTQLLSLDLSYQQFERAKKLDIGLISSSLAGNLSLKELILSFNKLNDADAQTLASGLHGNRSLRKLDLRANNIRDAGAVAIAENLVNHSALKQLFMFGNPFRRGGSIALLNAIRYNFELEILNMDYNTCFYDSIQFFSYLNQAGRRILKDDSFNPALWPLVLVRAKSISDRSRGICMHAEIVFQLVQGSLLLR
jgi:Ran GTPase-activating protein (RanGAP) involved in mRNA processing and transport